MPVILIIDKSGNVKEQSVKLANDDEIYKKAGFKNAEGFKCHATWGYKTDSITYSVSMYGKTNGRAGDENKYDFPPPVDKELFFGQCAVVGLDASGAFIDLT
jgi:hypothetical protein